MPLLDHFHEPLSANRAWESFHATWAGSLMDQLNRLLPRRYIAEIQVHLGSRVEADVAEWERIEDEDPPNGKSGGVAVQTWAPPAPPVVFSAVFPDDIEVQVRDKRRDYRLAGVVELVSPGNKDRPESRRAFAAKCAAYLARGVGVIVADIVTEGQSNLHNELMDLLRHGEPYTMPEEAFLYAVAYRPARRGDANEVDAWPTPLALGGPLPVLPLALRGTRAIPLDLDAAYTDARERSRL